MAIVIGGGGLLLSAPDVAAQQKLKFNIVDFGPDQFDLSAKDPRFEKFDGNGDRYAIIKVTSTNPDDKIGEYNFNFGNLKHIIEERDGALWVYVQRNAKLVTITREGYAPITKYDLHTTLESGRNYVMSLSSEARQILTQLVKFEITPPDCKAVVMVKSFVAGSTEEIFGTADTYGMVAKALEYGKYSYKVMADNYYTAEGQFTLNDKATTLIEKVTLRANFGTITLKVPGQAEIYVNSQLKGRGTWTGPMRAGKYTVECRQAGHTPSSTYIEVTENEVRTIDLPAPVAITGQLAVTSVPSGAQILIDGKNTGQVTPANLDVVIGRHTLTLRHEGFSDTSEEVEVDKQTPSSANVTLSRTATLTFNSYPSDRDLYVDGKLVGRTPYEYTGPIGNHSFSIPASYYYKGYSKTHYVGKETSVTANLKEKVHYGKLNQFYISLGGDLCSNIGPAATIGFYAGGFNLEGFFTYGTKFSDPVYLVSKGGWEENDYSYSYNPGNWYGYHSEEQWRASIVYGGRIGYGFQVPRTIITPQMGLRMTMFTSENYYYIEETYCLGMSLGCRVALRLARHISLTATPEYIFAVKKPEGYTLITDVSSSVKGMAEGFNCNLSIAFTF